MLLCLFELRRLLGSRGVRAAVTTSGERVRHKMQRRGFVSITFYDIPSFFFVCMCCRVNIHRLINLIFCLLYKKNDIIRSYQVGNHDHPGT